MKNKDKAKEKLLKELAEKKLSEEALRESEKRYRTLIEKNPYGIQEIDSFGTIIYANKAHHDMYGYEEGDLLGRSITDFLVPGKQHDELLSYLAILMKDQPPPTMYHQKILTKHGKERDIEVAWNYLRDNKGNVIGFLSVLTDITEREKTAIALTDNMNMFRGLVETTSDWIWEVEENAVYTYVSSKIQDILGYEPEEILGKTPFAFMPPNEAKRVADIFSPIATSQKPFKELENTNLHKDGRLVVLETSGVPITNMDGEFCGYRGIDRDITERKKAEEKQDWLTKELVIKNKELEQVLYVTSHDLRSPLVNIEGYSKELDYSLKELMSSIENVNVPSSIKEKIIPIAKEDIPESLHYIQVSVAKMETLLKGISTLSRLGRSELKIEEIDMSEMMTDIVDTHRFRLNELKIKMEVSNLPNCKGDSVQINQVFSNLLDNAIKYSDSERSGVINVSGYTDKTQSVYCIDDSGIGIAPEHQDKIFDIFHQLEPNRVKGEGMGLTIAGKIVEKHNGKIWVESELGKGSKFFISLPS